MPSAIECKPSLVCASSSPFVFFVKEVQTKREAIKRYEQELQSMKQFFDITMKEKQIQSDQLQHERQRKATNSTSLLSIDACPCLSVSK